MKKLKKYIHVRKIHKIKKKKKLFEIKKIEVIIWQRDFIVYTNILRGDKNVIKIFKIGVIRYKNNQNKYNKRTKIGSRV